MMKKAAPPDLETLPIELVEQIDRDGLKPIKVIVIQRSAIRQVRISTWQGARFWVDGTVITAFPGWFKTTKRPVEFTSLGWTT